MTGKWSGSLTKSAANGLDYAAHKWLMIAMGSPRRQSNDFYGLLNKTHNRMNEIIIHKATNWKEKQTQLGLVLDQFEFRMTHGAYA